MRSLILICLILGALGVVESFNPETYLQDWFKYSKSFIGGQTLMDISLAGTHDTLTYDLDNVVAQNANDLPFELSYLMNKYGNVFPIDLIGDFIRTQAKTQGLNITEQLNSGIRYIDFRIIYSEDPKTKVQNWYSMHMVQSKQTAYTYLQEIRDWLEKHNEEIIVLSFSRHGGLCYQGEQAYPNVKYEQKEQFWNNFTSMYEGLLFNKTKKPLNESTIGYLWDNNYRVIVYASDYANFTNNSELAQDGCLVINEGSIDSTDYPQGEEKLIQQFKNMEETIQTTKAQNKFYLKSLAGGAPSAQLIYAFEIEVLGNRTKAQEKCAALFNIPNNQYCPLELQGASQLANYYNQISLHEAFRNGYRFPNAFYLDAVDVNGTFRVGTELFPNPKVVQQNKGISIVEGELQSTDTKTQKYAYVWILLNSNLNIACKNLTVFDCYDLPLQFNKQIQLYYPYTRWDETQYGRLSTWPEL